MMSSPSSTWSRLACSAGNEIGAPIHNRWIAEPERHLHEQLVDVHAEIPGGDRLEAAFHKGHQQPAVGERVDVAGRIEMARHHIRRLRLHGGAEAIETGHLHDQQAILWAGATARLGKERPWLRRVFKQPQNVTSSTGGPPADVRPGSRAPTM